MVRFEKRIFYCLVRLSTAIGNVVYEYSSLCCPSLEHQGLFLEEAVEAMDRAFENLVALSRTRAQRRIHPVISAQDVSSLNSRRP